MSKITADNWKASRRIEHKYYTMIQKLLEPVKKEYHMLEKKEDNMSDKAYKLMGKAKQYKQYIEKNKINKEVI